MVALTHWVCFLFFLRELRCYGTRLSVVFQRLVRLGSFPACWRQANVTPIPKGPLCSSVAHTLQSAQEARIVQIDFSAAFARVNRRSILYKLCSVGIRGSVLSILTQFLSNQSQYVMVDGCRSKLVNVVSGVPQGSVLSPLLFLLYTCRAFFLFRK